MNNDILMDFHCFSAGKSCQSANTCGSGQFCDFNTQRCRLLSNVGGAVRLMRPWGPNYGDHVLTGDDSKAEIALSFPFVQHYYSKLFIGTNG
jgi:hypothetical protein